MQLRCGCSIQVPVNLSLCQPRVPRCIKSIRLTFKPQMLPTLSFSLTSGTEEEGAASPVSSLSPRSLARCSRHMKQKLVLISASFSPGYERCNPTITSSNVRASSGLVTPSVSLSTSCQSKKKVSFRKSASESGVPYHLFLVG